MQKTDKNNIGIIGIIQSDGVSVALVFIFGFLFSKAVIPRRCLLQLFPAKITFLTVRQIITFCSSALFFFFFSPESVVLMFQWLSECISIV